MIKNKAGRKKQKKRKKTEINLFFQKKKLYNYSWKRFGAMKLNNEKRNM